METVSGVIGGILCEASYFRQHERSFVTGEGRQSARMNFGLSIRWEFWGESAGVMKRLALAQPRTADSLGRTATLLRCLKFVAR